MIRRVALPEPAATVVAGDKARAALGRSHSDFHRPASRPMTTWERFAQRPPPPGRRQRRLQDGDFTWPAASAAAGLQNTGSTASPAVLTCLLAADLAVRQSTPGHSACAMAEQELTPGQA